jgi:hypothetical protein
MRSHRHYTEPNHTPTDQYLDLRILQWKKTEKKL